MATIVNTPGGTADSGGGMGFFLGMLALIVVVVLFLVYGIPMMRGSNTSAPQINVPDSVDVNLQQPQGGQ